ncbi:MAG: N,N'-diacetyllegionaminic acid synthase [Alphaproteobacteria bacterium MarineAlpha5_Bin9]|nr:MAG: N,N'-diacetyllegionaminic acid synthase [Alphaproteobacteria bacterium MarineAlpha5_Bin9]|tara:strand:- start:12549 stop:13607 length:1059 start_codon:yes stop_codon:yes gene_type:complete
MHKVFLKNDEIINKNFPYVIAEIGVNHEGSLTKAKELIDLAALGGAHAAKFQTYKANNLASINSPAYWDTNKEKSTNQNELFKKYDAFNKNEYYELHNHCKRKDIDFLSTPFDIESVEYLDPVLKFYKIASADITNVPLLTAIANKKKPIVISTGASKMSEIKFAHDLLKKNGCPDVSILHCVLNYPTLNENANLLMIRDLSETFPRSTIGYSDHTIPDEKMFILTTAYLMGAKIIEKHFTDDKTLKGNDHYHAMDYEDLKKFFSNLRNIINIQGYKKKDCLPTEEISRLNARRSIIVSKKILKGEKISSSNITCKRPGSGISPIHWNDILNKKVNKNLDIDDILNWDDLKT